jgi:selenium metabolism protein YedF
MEKILDCMGMACPLPVVNAKKAIESFEEDGTLTVKVDNDTAVQNLTRLAGHFGFAVSSEKQGDQQYVVIMQVKAGAKVKADEIPAETLSCPAGHKNGKVVVLSGDIMGSGDEKLGKKLMKAFIYALTSQDVLPDKVICYNRGAFLTTEDPDTVRDLQNLEKEGTVIMTCGTCLDYYGLKEKLQVGIISNMYDIVETLMNASSVIKP